MKISVITPSFNSGDTIERAIKSVLAQDYEGYEHIVVDGGSTDNTLDVIRRYSHLKWISEPDRGQVHAMNKGFSMAEGDIIGYLNADDYYFKGAFSAVIPCFQAGEKMVVGKIRVFSEKNDGIKEWVCDPKTDFTSTIRHWENNAFCVNPVGYFYRREVQEKVPYQEESGAKHDLEFLMETALHFTVKKIDSILGVFNHAVNTQTAREQLLPSYWQLDNFPFVERLAANLPEEDQNKFRMDREKGYQLRRRWTAQEAFAHGLAKELFDKGEVFMLPEDEEGCHGSRCGFVEHDRIGTNNDWIIPVMTMGKVASKSICHTLKNAPQNDQPAQVYHIHQMNPVTLHRNLPGCLPDQCHQSVGLSLKHLFDLANKELQWKFIAGVRDPLSLALSGVFEIWPDIEEKDIPGKMLNIFNYIEGYFFEQYYNTFGIDVFESDFDHDKEYSIITKGNIQILLYRLEDLEKIFPRAMEEFLGIPNLRLSKINIGEKKSYSDAYKKAKGLRFEKFLLDKIYSFQYIQHFYKNEEIDRFYRKWSATKPTKAKKTNQLPEFHGLIYDIGAHEGQDTGFYLKKGFRVVAVDANPAMIEKVQEKFSDYIASGQLMVCNAGIVGKPMAEKKPFFINDKSTSWSSFLLPVAGRDGTACREILVPCLTMGQLFEEYGKPYYVKIDIEGYDHIALESIKQSGVKPKYISVENGFMGMLNSLTKMGFSKFKYVQQNNLPSIILPNPPLEGDYVSHSFTIGSSGPFGEETPGRWKNKEEIRKIISKVWNPEGHDKNPHHKDEIHGWFDLHAKY